jgi:hypothetical protein
MTWLSIELHESGHFLVYALARQHARLSFQRVTPLGAVSEQLRFWATLAGPAVSLVAAIAFLAVARRKQTFAWATLALTNASIRLFPCTMDLFRAVQARRPFSDEGEVALALGRGWGRIGIIALVLGAALYLTVLAARTFPFKRYWALKAALVYLCSLFVGLLTVLADDLLGFNG